MYLVVVVGERTRFRTCCWAGRAEGALGLGDGEGFEATDTGIEAGSGRGAIGVKWGPDVC